MEEGTALYDKLTYCLFLNLPFRLGGSRQVLRLKLCSFNNPAFACGFPQSPCYYKRIAIFFYGVVIIKTFFQEMCAIAEIEITSSLPSTTALPQEPCYVANFFGFVFNESRQEIIGHV